MSCERESVCNRTSFESHNSDRGEVQGDRRRARRGESVRGEIHDRIGIVRGIIRDDFHLIVQMVHGEISKGRRKERQATQVEEREQNANVSTILQLMELSKGVRFDAQACSQGLNGQIEDRMAVQRHVLKGVRVHR